jgi:hypothetical protein
MKIPSIRFPASRLSIGAIFIVAITLAACIAPVDDLTPIPTQMVLPTPTLTATPIVNLSATPLLAPSTSTPTPIGQGDYRTMIHQMSELIDQADYDVGIAFVDIVSGQSFTLGRQGRFHAMSTFKGPLAAYYLWLIEQGVISEQQGDEYHIKDMLTWSSNSDTSCIFKRVGGIAGFNDWLANEGFSRENDFVYSWHQWICEEHGERYAPAPDERYHYGDTDLGLPGNGTLLQCPDSHVPCDKAFVPLDLVEFYSQLYQGQVLDQEDTERWLKWMEKPLPITSMFDSLPSEAQGTVHAYTKNGYYPADKAYPMNFYHEAGILETPEGAFALAVFMQDNPEWRGTDIHGEIGLLAYANFMMVHEQQ